MEGFGGDFILQFVLLGITMIFVCDISVEIEITDKIYKLSKINGGKD